MEINGIAMAHYITNKLDQKFRLRFAKDSMSSASPDLSAVFIEKTESFFWTFGENGQLRIIKQEEYDLYQSLDGKDAEIYAASMKPFEYLIEGKQVSFTIMRDIRVLFPEFKQNEDVVVLFLEDSFEIWGTEKYKDFLAEKIPEIKDLAMQSAVKAPVPKHDIEMEAWL